MVSVIIPVYNAAHYLPRCLDSVLAQTYQNLEVIAVDDGSTDDSANILKTYADKDERIHLLRHSENKGQAAARNLALDAASGAWIAFVDSDDMCQPAMIQTLLEKARSAQAQVCWGAHFLHDEARGITILEHRKPGIYRGKAVLDWYFKEAESHPYLCVGIYRTEIFYGLRFPEGRIYEDTYLVPRILERAEACVCIDVPIYHYYQRTHGTCGGSTMDKQMDLFWVQAATIDFVTQRHPAYIGYAQKHRLELCCILLGMIDRAGRRRYAAYWQQVTAAFADASGKMQGGTFYHRAASLLFRMSPILFAKVYRLHGFLKGRLRNHIHGKPAERSQINQAENAMLAATHATQKDRKDCRT